ncbi:zinc finger protein 250-like isoform X1 [Microplitis mediator]|uniref:zinc finger protein 250-like isoform X1 n=1 Tax=Microplitis mediator TaxID=375433 RepID=UPI0025535935|nr:zinc finger protein 250-like isoform X1 [Microplitis mediator]XP_057333349.1 zinc finger protein 250-like isoform X1 [Microplitis mediator]
MDYGIWGLHAASRLWGDPRLARHPIIPPGAPQLLSRAVLTLSALQQQQQLSAAMATEAEGSCQAIELTAKSSSSDGARSETSTPFDRKKSEDNESNIEKDDDDYDENTGINDNEDPGDESDTGSTNSSHPSGNNNLPNNLLDPMSCFGFDKDETVTPMLNGWVLGAYTAMLGRLSAATAALEAIEVPSMPSGSESESDESSYTEKSRDNSPVAGAYRGYPCGSCDVVASTRPALKKHLLDCHPASSSGSEASSTRTCPSAGCDFTSKSRCEMETHVAGHVQGMTSTGKKRSLALQRVRYRYEREEYRCSLCSYACTIEKAFQRHLRAHARGSAPETRVSCAVCGADRSSEVDLSRHMRRHRDDRYFCCDICVFRTVQLKKLIQHRRMHTGEKPHLCPHCAYRSARRDNLRSHVRRVHKKENLYCDTFSPRGMLMNPSLTPTNNEDLPASTNLKTPASPAPSNSESTN